MDTQACSGPAGAALAAPGCPEQPSVLTLHGSVSAYVQKVERANSMPSPPSPQATMSEPVRAAIAAVEAEKAEAVACEDYERAGRLKQVLAEMKRLAAALLEREAEKRDAVAREDFEAAAAAKRDVQELTAQIVSGAGAKGDSPPAPVAAEAVWPLPPALASSQPPTAATAPAPPSAPPLATPTAAAPELAGGHAKHTGAPPVAAQPHPVPAAQIAPPAADTGHVGGSIPSVGPPCPLVEQALAQRAAHGSVAVEHAECPICFEALPNAPAVVLVRRGRRSCTHFFHESCAAAMGSAVGGLCCPCCRAEYDSVWRVPSVEADPRGWFDLVDFDGNGSLDQSEVVEVLKATLPLDHRMLEEDLPLLFPQWDPNNDGRVEYDEMMGPHGLFFYVRDAFRAKSKAPPVIPDIRADRKAWFRFWDEDGSGTLDMEEVLRSFVKTFRLSADVRQVQTLRELLGIMWSEFDPDNSGEIDADEFCRPVEGLADMVIANLG